MWSDYLVYAPMVPDIAVLSEQRHGCLNGVLSEHLSI